MSLPTHPMAKLNLSVAVRDYDRTRPLSDGLVQIDGVDPVFMALDPEEIFFRAFRHAEFDICELSLSSASFIRKYNTLFEVRQQERVVRPDQCGAHRRRHRPAKRD